MTQGLRIDRHETMKTTACTPAARRKAKQLLAAFRKEQIQIWKSGQGFQVVTFERPGHTYGSCEFATKSEAFRHIIKRCANTGFDLARFDAIATRFFRRFLAA